MRRSIVKLSGAFSLIEMLVVIFSIVLLTNLSVNIFSKASLEHALLRTQLDIFKSSLNFARNLAIFYNIPTQVSPIELENTRDWSSGWQIIRQGNIQSKNEFKYVMPMNNIKIDIANGLDRFELKYNGDGFLDGQVQSAIQANTASIKKSYQLKINKNGRVRATFPE